MTQHNTPLHNTPLRPHTKIAYSTPKTNHQFDNYLQRKESNERLLNEGDGEWVDYSDEDQEAHRQSEKANARQTTSVESSINYRTSPRKRVTRRTVQAASLSRKSGSVPSSPKPHHPAKQETHDETRDVVLKALLDGARFSGQYVLSILQTVSHLARWPIAFCITSFLLMIMMGYISKTLRRAFEPLCIIPGISSLAVCNPGPETPSSTSFAENFTPKWADYPKLMDMQTQSFEQLLGDAVGGSALSLEIKKAEIATTDLITRVRVSDLRAKDTLAASLSEFVEDAKKAGRSLQKLTSKVGGAVDSIMAVNDYALQSIASARENEPPLWSLRSFVLWAAPTQRVDEVVTQTFDEAMNVLSANMERLILEAEHNLHNLNNLEERLATLHEVVVREDSSISSAKSDLLEDLWTKLGGNRKSLRNYEHHLLLLKGLGTYRKQALAHVVAALQTLHAMSEDMEDMRERVAAPDLMGATVPVEVHMKSIQAGLERLREGRIRAKKLEEDAIRKVLLVDD